MGRRIWLRRGRRTVYLVSFFVLVWVIFFLLIPSLLLTHTRVSGQSSLSYECDPMQGNVAERIVCESVTWYLGLFEDDLQRYDVKKVHENIAGTASQVNTYTQTLTQEFDTYIQTGSKRQVKYIWDDQEGSYISR